MKQRLLTPGPTPVPEETLLELAKPVFYHRTPEFRQILAEVLEDLQYVFQTRNPVLPLTSSGTGGMEAAIANCLPPGSKAICLIAGRLGERWRNICKAFGVEAVSVDGPARARRCSPSSSPRRWPSTPTPLAVCCHAERDLHRRRQRHRGVRQAGRADAGRLAGGRHQRPGRRWSAGPTTGTSTSA